ncbi:MAG: hypothetical protein EZS28_014679 [Streblomastix strix]|uniref:SPRY domain-containing protein n=1 Tax=Streblomastix strix TaxID=222440 RepID=A0A5J4W521_9EUKA|nr:MAG: hypothetical protein EZS28_014679 [Streblomastix strix]
MKKKLEKERDQIKNDNNIQNVKQLIEESRIKLNESYQNVEDIKQLAKKFRRQREQALRMVHRNAGEMEDRQQWAQQRLNQTIPLIPQLVNDAIKEEEEDEEALRQRDLIIRNQQIPISSPNQNQHQKDVDQSDNNNFILEDQGCWTYNIKFNNTKIYNRIGVIDKSVIIPSSYSPGYSKKSIVYNGIGGCVLYNGIYHHGNEEFRSGETVGIEMDHSNHTVRFTHTGNRQRISFTNIPLNVRAFVWMGIKSASAEFVSVEWSPQSEDEQVRGQFSIPWEEQ